MPDDLIKDSITNPPTVGGVLLAERMAKGLTQQQVSDVLRFNIKQIEALENNAFQLLPQPMIVRGFIKSYAQLLEIDATPLLESYNTLTPSNAPNVIRLDASEAPLKRNPFLSLQFWLMGLLLVLFGAFFFYKESAPPVIEPVIKAETATPSPALPTVTTYPIEMAFSAEAWVRATDQSGQVVFEKTATAQSVEKFSVEPPLYLEIGNVEATQLTFMGKAVDLTPYTTQNVAKLTLDKPE